MQCPQKMLVYLSKHELPASDIEVLSTGYDLTLLYYLIYVDDNRLLLLSRVTWIAIIHVPVPHLASLFKDMHW